jgi:hypothetical protein
MLAQGVLFAGLELFSPDDCHTSICYRYLYGVTAWFV